MSMFKRIVSSILVLAFLVSTVPVFAEDAELDETYRALVTGTEEELTEFPNGKIEFLYSTIEAAEGGSENELVVLRRGGTAGEVSVELKFIDISASYNKDYYIEIDGEHYQPDATFPSFMEAYVDQDLSVDEQDVSSIQFDILSEPKAVEEPSEVAPEQQEEKPNSLIEDRNAYFGNKSDRSGTDGRLAGEEERAEYNQKSESLFNGTEGLTLPLTFAEGEFEKRLNICVVNDDVYKGERQATFSLVNVETAVLGDNMNGYLNISDDEEVEKSTISTADTVYVDEENHTATLTLERTSGIDTFTVISVETQDGTAVAGEDYKSIAKNVIFVPGATTRSVTIPVAKDVTEDKQFEVLLSGKEDAVLTCDSVTVNLQSTAAQVKEDAPVRTQAAAAANAPTNDPTLEYVQYFGSDFEQYIGNRCKLDGTSIKMSRTASLKITELNFTPYYKAEVFWENYYTSLTNNPYYQIYFNFKGWGSSNSVKLGKKGSFAPTVSTITFTKDDLQAREAWEEMCVWTDNAENATFHWVKLYRRKYNVEIVDTNDAKPQLYGNYYSKSYTRRYHPGIDGEQVSDGKVTILNGGTTFSGAYSGNPVTLHPTSSNASKFVGYRLLDENNNASEIIKSDEIPFSDEFVIKYSKYMMIDAFDAATKEALPTATLRIQPVFERLPSTAIFINNSDAGNVYYNGQKHASENGYMGDVLWLTVKGYQNHVPDHLIVTRGDSLKSDGTVNGTPQLVKGTPANTPQEHHYTFDFDAPYISFEPTFTPPTLTVMPAYGTPENEIKRGNIFTLVDEAQKDTIIEGLVPDSTQPGPSDFPVVMASTDTDNGKNKIVLGPTKLNTPYLFSFLQNLNIPQKYIASWTNASGLKDMSKGEVAGSDSWRLDQKKNDPNFNLAIYGNDVNLLPLYRNSGWYYSFVPLSDRKDYVGGTIKINEINMLTQDNPNYSAEQKATKIAPCPGAVVTISGLKGDNGQPYSATCDEKGKFFIDNVKGMLNGHQYAVTVDYNNQREYTYVTAGNTGMEITLNPYKIMRPNTFRVTKAGGNSALLLSNITYSNQAYDFHFNVTSSQPGIGVKNVYLAFYKKDGTLATTYKASPSGSGGFSVKNINPMKTRAEASELADDLHTNHPDSDLGVGAYTAIWVTDEYGNVYPTVKTGVPFIQGLASTISMNLGFNMEQSTATDKIPLLGTPDGTVAVNASIKSPQTDAERLEYEKQKIPFMRDVVDIDGGLSKEAIIGAGIGQASKLTSASDMDARKMIMEADRAGIEKMAEEAGENEFLNPVPISTKTMFQFDFGMRLRLDYDNVNNTWTFTSLLGAANLRAALGDQEMLTTIPIWGPFQVILKMGLTANVYGMVSISNDPTKDFLVTVGNHGDLNFEPDWLINDKLASAVQLYISGTIMGGVGVGFGKCLYVSVDVSGTLEFMFDTFKKGMGSVTFGVGIDVRLLVFTLRFDIAKKKIQMYSYGYDRANQDMYTLMNESIQEEMAEVMSTPLSQLEPMARDYLEQAEEYSGNTMGRAAAGTSSKLKDGVFPYPKSQLVDVSYNGAEKSMLVFLDDNRDRDANNRTELYYRINNNGVWSEQLPVCEDGTLDDSFHVLDGGDKVLITWTNASRAITDEDTSTDAVKVTRIKAIVFDKATGALGEPMDVTKTGDDDYADSNPTAVLAPNGDIMVFYTNTDYNNVTTGGGLNDELIPDDTLDDLSGAYSALCYKVWEKENQAWRTTGSFGGTGKYFLNTEDKLQIDEYKMTEEVDVAYKTVDEEGNEIDTPDAPTEKTTVTLSTIDQQFAWNEAGATDPNILEYKANITQEADGKQYVVIAYVRDSNYPYPTNANESNQQVYMQVYDLTEHTMTLPLRITNDANVRRHSKLQFAVVEGVNVLTWVSDESIYDRYIDDPKNPVVPQPAPQATVVKTVSQINQFSLAAVMPRIKMAEVSHDGTETSHPYIDKGVGTTGDPIRTLLECGPADSMMDFTVLNANGESVATWTTEEKDGDKTTLYANAMRMSMQPNAEDEELTPDDYYVTTPTKLDLSESGFNITAFTGLPRSNGQVLFVWNQFKHGQAKPVHTMYTILAQPTARPRVSAVKFEGRGLSNGEITVSGYVTNESLTDLSGDATLTLLINSEVLVQKTLTNKMDQPGLGAGDTVPIEATVALPADISGLNFKVVLKQGNRTWESSKYLEVEGEITVDPYLALSFVSRNEGQATFKVKNTGNAVTEAREIPILCGETTVATAKIPALQVDEEHTQTIKFPISPELFTDDGLAEADGYSESAIFEIQGDVSAKGFLRRSVTKDQADSMGLVTDFTVSQETLALTVNEERAIIATADGLNANTHIAYYSANPDVAVVYGDGTVRGVSAGTATVYAVVKPKDTDVIVAENPYSAQSNLLNIPEEYLQSKAVSVTVSESNSSSDGDSHLGVAAPKASVASGAVANGTKVELRCNTRGAKIYYTLDGTRPTDQSALYTEAIVIEAATTLKAVAIKDRISSPVLTVKYTLTEEAVIAAPKFTDLTGYRWAEKEIAALAEMGIIKGVSETEFAPTSNITRADYLLLLVRMLGLSTDVTDNFSDVEKDAYYYEEIGIAKALGITSGIGKNKFDPGATITRQDMFVLAYRVLQLQEVTLEGASKDALSAFADGSQIAGYAKEAFAVFVENNLVKGSVGNLYPANNATRAETAVFIYRLNELMSKALQT